MVVSTSLLKVKGVEDDTKRLFKVFELKVIAIGLPAVPGKVERKFWAVLWSKSNFFWRLMESWNLNILDDVVKADDSVW